MGWVGASYGSVSKQTRVSKPDSRIENRRAKLQKCRGGGMTTYPYIYIYTEPAPSMEYKTNPCVSNQSYTCVHRSSIPTNLQPVVCTFSMVCPTPLTHSATDIKLRVLLNHHKDLGGCCAWRPKAFQPADLQLPCWIQG